MQLLTSACLSFELTADFLKFDNSSLFHLVHIDFFRVVVSTTGVIQVLWNEFLLILFNGLTVEAPCFANLCHSYFQDRLQLVICPSRYLLCSVSTLGPILFVSTIHDVNSLHCLIIGNRLENVRFLLEIVAKRLVYFIF